LLNSGEEFRRVSELFYQKFEWARHITRLLAVMKVIDRVID
jgi:hypothetical protein